MDVTKEWQKEQVAQTSCEVDTEKAGEEEQRWVKGIGDEMA